LPFFLEICNDLRVESRRQMSGTAQSAEDEAPRVRDGVEDVTTFHRQQLCSAVMFPVLYEVYAQACVPADFVTCQNVA
jgi:hypothetical protein